MNACFSTVKNHLIVFGLYAVSQLVFEFWIGKTDKIKASSALELILIGFGATIGVDLIGRIDRLFNKKGDSNGNRSRSTSGSN